MQCDDPTDGGDTVSATAAAQAAPPPAASGTPAHSAAAADPALPHTDPQLRAGLRPRRADADRGRGALGGAAGDPSPSPAAGLPPVQPLDTSGGRSQAPAGAPAELICAAGGAGEWPSEGAEQRPHSAHDAPAHAGGRGGPPGCACSPHPGADGPQPKDEPGANGADARHVRLRPGEEPDLACHEPGAASPDASEPNELRAAHALCTLLGVRPEPDPADAAATAAPPSSPRAPAPLPAPAGNGTPPPARRSGRSTPVPASPLAALHLRGGHGPSRASPQLQGLAQPARCGWGRVCQVWEGTCGRQARRVWPLSTPGVLLCWQRQTCPACCRVGTAPAAQGLTRCAAAADTSVGRSPLGRRSPAGAAALPLFTGGAHAALEAASPGAATRGRARLPAPAALAALGLGATGPGADRRAGGADGAAGPSAEVGAREGLRSEGLGGEAGAGDGAAGHDAAGGDGGAGADFFAPAFVNGAPPPHVIGLQPPGVRVGVPVLHPQGDRCADIFCRPLVGMHAAAHMRAPRDSVLCACSEPCGRGAMRWRGRAEGSSAWWNPATCQRAGGAMVDAARRPSSGILSGRNPSLSAAACAQGCARGGARRSTRPAAPAASGAQTGQRAGRPSAGCPPRTATRQRTLRRATGAACSAARRCGRPFSRVLW